MSKQIFKKSEKDAINSFGNYPELSECAKFCLEKSRTEKDHSTNWILSYTMLSALSIEMCIKRLLFENGTSFDFSHDLSYLFNLLPEEIKKTVREKYHVRNKEINIFDIDNFDDLLKETGKHFVELRYITKKVSGKMLQPDFFQILMDIFLEIM